MQSVAKTSVKCRIGCGASPPPPVSSVAHRPPCPRSRCRAFTSTASLSTWQTTKQFSALHAPARSGESVVLARQLSVVGVAISYLVRSRMQNMQFSVYNLMHLFLVWCTVQSILSSDYIVQHAPDGICANCTGSSCRQVTRMGNKSTGGIFVPIVKLTRKALGQKEFNALRGKGISLHSQGAQYIVSSHTFCPFVVV